MEGQVRKIGKAPSKPAPCQRVLVLGSGALQIGQAGEFDYSGSQALKALREEGVYTVLINPNIATIQTDDGLADETYFLPVEPHFVEQVLEKERCDAILLGFGGQTGLNCGLALEESGALERLGVRVLGTPVSTIRDTEDRHLFVQRLNEIGVLTARSRAVRSSDEAVRAAAEIGYPVMLRAGFALGGQGSSIVHDARQCLEVADAAFASAPQILVEECLAGWKEIEYEVVRDGADNCITVCNMENVDPMGIHTGESIVVAPSQTLDDREYHLLRDISIRTIRHLGIVGECNIQFALDPRSPSYRVIEVNARLSRSSALASKATGYPLAYVAAKIALGYTLPEIRNSITKVTTAFFEPALDYIVCKIPRWDLAKFEGADTRIGSEMKSVGEVMALGRSFPEVLQKALRMLDIGALGLDPDRYRFDDLARELAEPTPLRVFAIAQALDRGMSLEEVARLTGIDLFFLAEIHRLMQTRKELRRMHGKAVRDLEPGFLRSLKQLGFADRTIAAELGATETDVRERRKALGIVPHLQQIDTLAAEYPAETNFLYFTHASSESDIPPSRGDTVLVLGSGCYRIGSSVEFDWCAVNAVQTLRSLGYQTVLLNCNPETVSTDYDICDRLVFDEISYETVLDLYEFEKPLGVIVSVGGQTANNLALKLQRAGVRVLGTSPESIDTAEDRTKFSSLLDRLRIRQPPWAEAGNLESIAATVADLGGYPVLVRPSYVLSGAAMRVAYDDVELREFLAQASDVSQEHPVVVSKFRSFAREIELDAVADRGRIVAWALCEHIEDAGVHSGDATLVIPPQRLPLDAMRRARDIGAQLARSLEITGPFNLQMLSKHGEVEVIELNLRASRSFPFVSKALGVNFISEATRLMLGHPAAEPGVDLFDVDYVAVKAPQFSHGRIKGADPRLGVEMRSTGEVACFGADTEEALLKAMMSAGFKRPARGVLLAIEPPDREYCFEVEARLLQSMGLELFASEPNCTRLSEAGIASRPVSDPGELARLLKGREVDWVVSVPAIGRLRGDAAGYRARRLAVDLGVSLTTDIWIARRVSRALAARQTSDLAIEPWSHYLKTGRKVDRSPVQGPWSGSARGEGDVRAARARPGRGERAI